MRYVVDVDGTRFEVTLDGGAASVDGGAPCAANLSEVPGTPVRIVRIGDAVHRVTVRREGARGRYVLRLGGRRFAVEALDERTRAIRDLSLAHARPAGHPALHAPMPGLIVRIHVAAGEHVEAGQGLVAMEAMKMENALSAPAAGRVKAVHAKVGEAVEKGALLVEFE